MYDLSYYPFPMQVYVASIVIIIGLIIGSFLNVVALRLLKSESFVFPPSACPKCKTKIKWYDNIPVFSYFVLLRGKCRACSEKISLQYPIVEAFTSIIFLAIFLNFGFSINTIFLWYLSSAMIIMAITDIKEQVIFDFVSYPIIPIGLVYSYFNVSNSLAPMINFPVKILSFSHNFVFHEGFVSSIIGLLGGFLFFEIISLISKLLIKQRAFGEGDTVIAMGLGAWFGWQLTVAIIIISFFVQFLVGFPIIIYNMYKNDDKASIFASFGLISSVFIPIIGKYTHFTDSTIGALITTFLALFIALKCSFQILRRAKEKDSYTFLPFGPALIIAAFVIIFFKYQILGHLNF